MAEQATMKGSRGTKTVLKLGLKTADVQLYNTEQAPSKLAQFETAGPNGGVLRRESRAKAAAEAPEDAVVVPVKVEDPVPPEAEMPKMADLAADREAAFEDAAAAAAATSEPGEYRSVLVEEGTGEEVEPDDVRHGVRLADGKFVDCTEELASIEARTQLDQMEVIGTVDATRLPSYRVKGSYYLTANGKDAAELMRVIYEASRKVRRLPVVKWTQKTRQKEGVIVPRPSLQGALLVVELVWAEDFRQPGPRQLGHMQAEVTQGAVDATAELLLAMADSPSLLDELRDDAIELREQLREKALAGKVGEFVRPPAPAQAEAEPSLEEQLAESIRLAREQRA